MVAFRTEASPSPRARLYTNRPWAIRLSRPAANFNKRPPWELRYVRSDLPTGERQGKIIILRVCEVSILFHDSGTRAKHAPVPLYPARIYYDASCGPANPIGESRVPRPPGAASESQGIADQRTVISNGLPSVVVQRYCVAGFSLGHMRARLPDTVSELRVPERGRVWS